MEEKEHDLEMNSRNLEQLKEMLEEKSQSSESNQQERLKNIAGEAAKVQIPESTFIFFSDETKSSL